MGICLFGSDGKESVCSAGAGVQSLGQEDPRRKEWLPIPVFLPGEFHRQRSLAGYSPWGHRKMDMTEQLIFSLSLDLTERRKLDFALEIL